MGRGRGYAAYHARRRDEELETLSLSDTLAEVVEQHRATVSERLVGFMDWARRIPEPKSGTLDFERFPFQKELYREGAGERELVVKKSTQVGVSAWLVRWTMFWADVRGLTALYVFPKQHQLYDFSDSRIRPLVLGSEYLRDRVPKAHVQNKGLKQIGLGFVYYRGSESKEALDAVDADVLALDEYDTLRQENVPDAERRITGSREGLIRRVGVPSIPDWGISKLYAESDRRTWQVKCEGCGLWQALEWPVNVAVGGHRTSDAQRCSAADGDVHIVCRDCQKPLDVRRGEWVPEFPDRDVRGYHVTRLMVPGANLRQIVDASQEREPYKVQTFWNKDLGVEFAPEEGRLSPSVLAAAERDYTLVEGYQGPELVTMGIDVASARALNVRISLHTDERVKGALWIGTVDSFDDLANLMDTYDVKMAAIDHLPERRLARSFAERFAGRVYLVRYAGPQAVDVISVDEEQRIATVRRTELLDATMQMIREQRNHLPKDRPDDYNGQMMSPVRFMERDELDRVKVAYRSMGPDDYAHAEAYDVAATELWWIRMQVEDAQREVLQPLENFLEFKRSDLTSEDEDAVMHYAAGPSEDFG